MYPNCDLMIAILVLVGKKIDGILSSFPQHGRFQNEVTHCKERGIKPITSLFCYFLSGRKRTIVRSSPRSQFGVRPSENLDILYFPKHTAANPHVHSLRIPLLFSDSGTNTQEQWHLIIRKCLQLELEASCAAVSGAKYSWFSRQSFHTRLGSVRHIELNLTKCSGVSTQRAASLHIIGVHRVILIFQVSLKYIINMSFK